MSRLLPPVGDRTGPQNAWKDVARFLPGDSPKQVQFLAAYSMLGIVGQAAKVAGCDRTAHNYWLAYDPDYPAKFADAQAAANDRLEAEARRRAVQGVEKVKFFKGAPIMLNGKPYTEHEYSDRLLEFLLKGELHDKYAERKKVETTGNMTILDPAVQAALIEFGEGEVAPDTPAEETTEETADAPEVPDA